MQVKKTVVYLKNKVPCRFCLAPNCSLECLGSPRDDTSIRSLYERNGYSFDLSNSTTSLRNSLRESGMKGISVIASIWMAAFFSFQCLLIDTMHAYDIGLKSNCIL